SKEAKPKKLSAIEAAAKVLGEAGEAMNCQEMIRAMADKGYWTSPGGKTPAATLYSSILRELQTSDAFDAGDGDEAIRSAQVARILIQDTGKSTSLLTHLGASGITLLSTCPPVSSTAIVFMGLINWQGGRAIPPLGNGNSFEIPVPEWWNQVVIVARNARL